MALDDPESPPGATLSPTSPTAEASGQQCQDDREPKKIPKPHQAHLEHGPAGAPARRRRRVQRACDECRRKRIKCTGEQPCENCTVYQDASGNRLTLLRQNFSFNRADPAPSLYFRQTVEPAKICSITAHAGSRDETTDSGIASSQALTSL